MTKLITLISKSFLLITFLLTINKITGQDNFLFFKISNINATQVVLYGLKGGEKFPLDTAYLQSTGAFVFNSINKHPAGVYRVYFSDSLYTELIFNNENIIIETNAENILGTMEVRQSIENRILFDYWNLALVVKDSILNLSRKRAAIEQKTYNSNHPDIIKINGRIKQLNDSVIQFVDTLLAFYPNLFAPKLLKSYQQPNFERYKKENPSDSNLTESDYYFDHFFDYIDFNDERFLYSKVIFTTLSDYITTFSNPASTSNYTAIIDKVMSLPKVDSPIYTYCLDLFMRTFENSIWEDVNVHLIEKYYLKSSNYSEAQKKYYKKLVARIKSLQPGQTAPALILPNESGEKIEVLKQKAKAKMIVFYSTQCPHCAEALPSLVEIANMYSQQGLVSYGVAIADESESWNNEIIKFGMNWVNLSDLKGMGSPIIDQFNITTTPAIFILADDNVIMAKPANTDQIHAVILQLIYNK